MAVAYLIDGETGAAILGRTMKVPRKVEELESWWKAACRALEVDVLRVREVIRCDEGWIVWDLSRGGFVTVDRKTAFLVG